MKFPVSSLFIFTTTALASTEVERIEEKKASRVKHGVVEDGLCHNKPLNANMLIARVSSIHMVIHAVCSPVSNSR